MAKILLADADQNSSRLTMEVLAVQGHTVVPARSAEDALNILRSDPAIQLILIEQILPDATGFKFAQLKAQDRQLKNIPVVMFLTKVDQNTLRTGLQVGVRDFLAKPWEPETLIDKINKALPRRKPVILIVEYENLLCDRLKYIIELKEFKVLTAATAEQGLGILQQKLVDVVIADIGLPEMPGPELIKKIKAAYPRLPVMLITGLSGRLSKEVARAAGADGSVSKPFRNVEIIEQLRGLTKRSSTAPVAQPR